MELNDRRVHKCGLCEKSFSKVAVLKKHELVHSGEKPHKCAHCNLSFAQKGNLKTHLEIHEGGKTYQCESCEKSIRGAHNLKVHKMIHTGEKPFSCSQCSEKKFDVNHDQIYIPNRKLEPKRTNLYNTNLCNVNHKKWFMTEQITPWHPRAQLPASPRPASHQPVCEKTMKTFPQKWERTFSTILGVLFLSFSSLASFL